MAIIFTKPTFQVSPQITWTSCYEQANQDAEVYDNPAWSAYQEMIMIILQFMYNTLNTWTLNKFSDQLARDDN